jgi:myo-inositol-1(or 4)-monophosphatase
MEKFIQDIAVQAGKITLKYFGSVHKNYKTKDHSMDIVTKGDMASNKFLVNAIKKKYPDHGIISEETGEHQANAKYIWTVDPVDGTLNFSRGIADYGVLISLIVKGKLELAVIYQPVYKDLYFAKKNHGAYLNGKKIKCSNIKLIENSFGMISSVFDKNRVKVIEKIIKVSPSQKFHARTTSSIAISAGFLASGKLDWYASSGGKLWDYAPVILMLQEAGCKATNLQGTAWQLTDRSIIAANPVLHKKLNKALNRP